MHNRAIWRIGLTMLRTQGNMLPLLQIQQSVLKNCYVKKDIPPKLISVINGWFFNVFSNCHKCIFQWWTMAGRFRACWFFTPVFQPCHLSASFHDWKHERGINIVKKGILMTSCQGYLRPYLKQSLITFVLFSACTSLNHKGDLWINPLLISDIMMAQPIFCITISLFQSCLILICL